MQKIIKIILSVYALSFLAQYAASPHVVMLSFFSYPGNTSTTYENLIQGIPVTYFGHRSISDHVGLVTFWYQGDKQLIYLLVCNQVEPIMAYHNTVDYWRVVEKAEYSFYVLEKKCEEKVYFWDIQKMPMEGARIPLNTIVVHVHPHEVYVPTGLVQSSNNLQLVLPAIYVKKINLPENIFRFTAISQFFARMNQTYNVSHDDLKVNQ